MSAAVQQMQQTQLLPQHRKHRRRQVKYEVRYYVMLWFQGLAGVRLNDDALTQLGRCEPAAVRRRIRCRRNEPIEIVLIVIIVVAVVRRRRRAADRSAAALALGRRRRSNRALGTQVRVSHGAP